MTDVFNGLVPPVSQSPLYKFGQSLKPGTVSARRGLASALADAERGSDQAKALHNFQMWQKRYVWTTKGIGYLNDNISVINGGAQILEFGKFYDSSGALNMVLQSGTNLYVYNTSSHAVGSALPVPFSLTNTAAPCIRPYAPSIQTASTISILCNGLQNPLKIINLVTAGTVTVSGGQNQQTLTVNGSLTSGVQVSVSISSTSLSPSPVTVTYTPGGGDTVNTVAGQLASRISSNSQLSAAGFTTAVTNNVITLSYPTTIAIGITSSTTTAALGATAGQAQQTIAVGGDITVGNVIKLFIFSSQLQYSPIGITYTPIVGDTIATVATGLAGSINTNVELVNAGYSATSSGAAVTLSYPVVDTVLLSYGIATKSAKITGTVGSGITFSITAGSTTVSYIASGTDTANTVAQNLALAVNANPGMQAQGISANFMTVGSPFITLVYPSQSSPSISSTANITLSSTNIETATIGGTPTAANNCYIFITISGTNYVEGYVQQATDTLTTVAANLANNTNNGLASSSTVPGVTYGLYAYSIGNVVLFSYPSSVTPTFSLDSVAGVTCTFAAGQSATATTLTFASVNPNSVWPVTFNGKTYRNPQFCEPFGNRMVYAGFPDANTQFDILMSNAGSAEQFSQAATILATDAWANTMNADLGPITGLKKFRPSNTNLGQVFIVGQRDGVSMINGTDSTNYNQNLLTQQYGIVNNRCWAQVLEDLVFMTDKGVYTFSSLVQDLTRPQDALSYVVSDVIQNIDWAHASNMFCVHHSLTQEIQFWFPYAQDNGQNARCLVLNYNTDNGLQAPVWSTKDFGGLAVSCGIDLRNVMYMSDYSGNVQKHYNGNTYNGAPILFDYLSSLITTGNIVQGARVRQLDVVTDGQGQQFAIAVFATTRYADGSSRRILLNPAYYILSDLAPGQTIFPFVFGSSSFPGDFVKKHTYSPIGQGFAFEIELTHTNMQGDGLDFSQVEYTLSVGGMGRR